jgi:hypothetical protein
MKLQVPLLLALAVQLAGAAGCKKSNDSSNNEAAPADPQTAEVDPSNATDVGPTVATDPLPAPPELKFEDPGPAPSEHHVWIEGYWWWDHPKRVYVWSPGFWQDRLAVATVAPPALIYEYPGRAPSALYVYIPGYWMWRGTEYVWYHGYWGFHRDGWAYVHPYWEVTGGHWHCSAWGWDRYHVGWETEHVGWEFHGGVWERPAEFHARVTLALGHAADYRVSPGTWHGHVVGRADVDVHGHVEGNVGANVHAGDTVHETGAHGGRVATPGEVHATGHAEGHEPEGHAPETHPGEGHATEGHLPQGHPAEGHYNTHPTDGHHFEPHPVERQPEERKAEPAHTAEPKPEPKKKR